MIDGRSLTRRSTNGEVHARVRPQGGFTLIELLVTLSIISLLIALLLPAMSSVRGRSRKFACKMNLRSVAFDFTMFADSNSIADRGEDEKELSGNQFRVETFQESQYRIDEYWNRAGTRFNGDVSDLEVMGCPELKGSIQIRSNTPCRSSAVGPHTNISYAFNLRLDSPEVRFGDLWRIMNEVPLTSRVLEAGMVPLVFDVDGVEAAKRFKVPYYSAPPIGDDRPYSSGSEWFPSTRHDGKTQVAFSSGEVLCSPDVTPQANPEWRWDYQAFK